MNAQPRARTIEDDFFQQFGAGLDWFRREDTGEFDTRLLDLWLGHPPEGVAQRIVKVFGAKALDTVFSIIKQESSK